MPYRKDGRLDRRTYDAGRRENARRGIATRRARGERIGVPIVRTPDAEGTLPCLGPCGERKPAEMFGLDRQRACGRNVRCKKCDSKLAYARLARRRALDKSPPPVVFGLGPLGPVLPG